MKAISVESISYSYEDGTEALCGLTFGVGLGEKVAILGPNGAGKSTLLELLMGLRHPQAGRIRIMGKELNEKNAPELRKYIGLVFQDPDDQIFMPRVWDDIAFGPLNMKLSRDEVVQRVEGAMSRTGLDGFGGRIPHNLSRGEKKRVAIAGVLAMEPEILLLDEPTAELDCEGKNALMQILEGLGKTIIIATHDIQVAMETTSRAVVIDHRNIGEGTYRELFSNQCLLSRAKLQIPPIPRLFASLAREGLDLGSPLSAEDALCTLKSKLKPKPPET